MKKKAVGYIAVWTLMAAAAALGWMYFRQARIQHGISEKVLRFHVLANSDSDSDQQLKLEVRDAVGCFMQEKLAGVDDLSECCAVVNENLDEIAAVAGRIIAAEGYDYAVSVAMEQTDFPEKNYGNYTFPAGNYEALRVVIGSGEGHNWWCVMYPNMCFENSMYEVVDDEAEMHLREVLTKEEYEKVLTGGNYKIQSKYFSFLNPYLNQLKE